MKYARCHLGSSSNGRVIHSPLHTARLGGFTLIEVMITSTLVAIGLLGHLSMQAKNFDMNRSGVYSSKASQLINEMADRMKSNIDGVREHEYDILAKEPLLALAPGKKIADHCNDCSNAKDIANLDKADWQSGMRELPYYSSKTSTTADPEVLTQGTIERISDTPNYVTYRITIAWPLIKEITENNATQKDASKQNISMIVGFAI